jgi:VWFA-related protein
MLSSLTLARRTGSQWLSRLLAVIVALIWPVAPAAFDAQTTNPQEISSRDVEPTFKMQAERNVVMVRVVVRDAKGAAVDNLRKEDFQLFDHGKMQTISHFSFEKPTLKAPEAPPQKSAEKAAPAEPEEGDETAIPVSAARRFVALYFDDVNTVFGDLAHARDAADHFLTSSIQPGDRVALYTSSGQKQLDFTENLAQVHQALLDLRPRPIIGVDTSCGAIPPYEAYLIVDQQDTTAIAVAADEILNCTPCPSQQQAQCLSQAQSMVQGQAIQSLTQSETESTAALRGIESVVRRLTSFPGQRSIVIVSAGFLTETLRFQLSEITDRAMRAGVVLNAIDARGLWIDPTLDASRSSIANSMSAALADRST